MFASSACEGQPIREKPYFYRGTVLLQKSLGYKAGFYCKTTSPGFFEYHASFFFIISLTLKPSTNIIFFYKYKFLAEEKHWRWRENIKVSPFILESTPSPPVPVPASPSQDKQMQYFLHFLSKIVLWVARLSHTVIKLHDLSWFGVKYNISLPD